MGQINTMNTNSKQKKDLRLTTWNVRSLYRAGGLRITINELRKYKIAITAIQETRWNKLTPQALTSNGYNIYTSSFAPTNDSKEEAKDQFYEQVERAYAACPSHDVKLVIGEVNAKVGRETVRQSTIGKYSLHERTHENGLRLVDFAAGRQMAIKSTYFMHKRIHLQTWHSPDGHTFN
jgi:hypothetical protein